MTQITNVLQIYTELSENGMNGILSVAKVMKAFVSHKLFENALNFYNSEIENHNILSKVNANNAANPFILRTLLAKRDGLKTFV